MLMKANISTLRLWFRSKHVLGKYQYFYNVKLRWWQFGAKRRQSPPDAKFPFQILVNVSSVVMINNAEICNHKTIPRIRVPYYCNVTFQCNVVIYSLSPSLLSVLFRPRDDDCCVQTVEQRSVRYRIIYTDPLPH